VVVVVAAAVGRATRQVPPVYRARMVL